MRSRPLAALLLAVLAGAAVACSTSDGRTLPPADPDRTTTTPSAPVIQPPTGDVETFTLRSTAFADGAPVPERLTCRGDEISPDLSWTGTPLDAVELAVVVRDRHAAGFVHWIVTGIDPFVQGVGEGGIPENAVEGPNDAGGVGWAGPCPPAGSGTHTYEVVLHALPSILALPPEVTPEQAAAAIEAASGQRAVLTGLVAAPTP